MLSKAEKIYMKFSEETIKIIIHKMLLLVLLKQINRHLEVLSYEQEVIDNFAIRDNINNAEMIMTKLFILMSEPNNKKQILFELSIAEFLILRDCVYCNNSLLHLQAKMKPQIIKVYRKFYEYIESIYQKLDSDEVKVYWDFIKNYKTRGNMLQ